MRILLVQTSFLGDTILSTPVIHGLKKIYPNAEIWMMTTPLAAELVERDPLLAGVIKLDKKKKAKGPWGMIRTAIELHQMGFDRAYSLHRSPRTALLLWLSRIPLRIGFQNAQLSFLYHQSRKRPTQPHDVIRNLSILAGEKSISQLNTRMRLFPPKKNKINSTVEQLLPKEKSYIVLTPGSAWPTKMWHWIRYREVAQFYIEKRIPVVLLGGPDEIKINDQVAEGLPTINLAGKASISDTMYVIQQAKLVICNDSMAMHMASALKVPNIAVFCATVTDFGFYPWQNNSRVAEIDLSCRPCSRHGTKKCPLKTDACMRDLSSGQVINLAENILGIPSDE